MALTPDDPNLSVEPPSRKVVINWTDRWLLPLLCVGVALDLLVSIGFGVAYFHSQAALSKADQAASSAHVARVVNYQSCLSTNNERIQGKRLWVWLVDQSYAAVATLPADQQAREKAELAKITTEVNETYALRDCSALNP